MSTIHARRLALLGTLCIGVVYVYKRNSPAPRLHQQSTTDATYTTPKPKLVILGSGWGAVSVLKSLTKDVYDVSIVSPSNYFLFTPLLPSASVGTLEPNSLTESTRKLAKRKDARYLQLEAYDVNFEDKEVVLQDQDGRNFHLPYDKLVIAVGSQSTTFNVPGVQDNCVFLKSLDDAVRIRSIILSNFERASLPTTTDTERARLLSFAVCGGGPTGTELLAELHDFIHDDLLRYFPTIRPSDIRLSIIQSQDHILNTYDKAISEYCEKQFKRNNINVLVNARVTRVEPHHVLYTEKGDPSKEEKSLDVGMCLWATGIDMIPFTKRIKQRLEAQNKTRTLAVDQFLTLKGIEDESVYAIGDCSSIVHPKLTDQVVDFFRQADHDNSGDLTLEEFEQETIKLTALHPHLAVHLDKTLKLVERFDADHSSIVLHCPWSM